MTRRFSALVLKKWFHSHTLPSLVRRLTSRPVDFHVELGSFLDKRHGVVAHRSIGTVGWLGGEFLLTLGELSALERRCLAVFVCYKRQCFRTLVSHQHSHGLLMYSDFLFSDELERGFDRLQVVERGIVEVLMDAAYLHQRFLITHDLIRSLLPRYQRGKSAAAVYEETVRRHDAYVSCSGGAVLKKVR